VFKKDVKGEYKDDKFFDIHMFQWQCFRRGQLSVDEQNACNVLLRTSSTTTTTTTTTTAFVIAERSHRQPYEEYKDDIVNEPAHKFFDHRHYSVHCGGKCDCKHPRKHLFVCFTKESTLQLAIEHTDEAKKAFKDLESRVQTTQILRLHDPLKRPAQQLPLNTLSMPEEVVDDKEGQCEFKHWEKLDLRDCANLFDYQIVGAYHNNPGAGLDYTYEYAGPQYHEHTGLQETKNVHLDFEVVVKKTDDPEFYTSKFEKDTEWEWEYQREHEV